MPVASPTSNFNLLVDTKEFIPKVLEDIQSARDSIAISMFAWAPTGPGKVIAEALKEKARHGVKVAVTLDGFGSRLFPFSEGTRLVKDLRKAGIDVKANWGLRMPWGTGKGAIDHRKIFVIDDSTAYVGGMNLSEKYYEWHDVMLRMTGAAAQAASDSFNTTWNRLGGDPSAINEGQLQQRRALKSGITQQSLPRESAHNRIDLVENKPHSDLKATREFFLQVANARNRIWIETPFIGSEKMVQALAAAARRGVDVRVVVPGPNKWKNGKVALHTTRTYYPDLLKAGAHLYEQPEMSHAKVWLIDDQSTVGSVNIDTLSEKMIYEIAAKTYSAEARQQVDELFQVDMARSRKIAPGDVKTVSKVGATLRKALL